ncbi:MAG: DUF6208 family protein [Halofilum sp. (in: g-proteobacteria)]|nr:DUF6208 family protein [Halofilum sp. (in: g-proteobacteria)]
MTADAGRPLRHLLGAASLRYFRHARRRKREAIVAAFAGTPGAWIPLSRWLDAAPDRERIMMLVGPRWNTDAVLAFTPMFEARERVTVDAGAAGRACPHWALVAYDGDLRTVAAVGSRSAARGELAIGLRPGRHFLALRYHGPGPGAHFPPVTVDGRPLVGAAPVADEAERYGRFLRGLRQRRRLEYRLLHYHAWVLLRDRDRFDEATVRRRYLPVGNPETAFAFGAIAAGERLRVEPSAVAGDRTHVTFYGVDSIPLAWYAPGGGGDGPSAPERGTYLVRRLHAAGSAVERPALSARVV